MKKFFELILIALIVVGCSGKKTPEEIFEEQKAGVVLILNKFYYEVSMPSGQKLYFTGIDKDGDLEGFTAELLKVSDDLGMDKNPWEEIAKEITLNKRPVMMKTYIF